MTYRLIFWCPIFFLKFDMITIRSHDYMYINIELEEANYVSEKTITVCLRKNTLQYPNQI